MRSKCVEQGDTEPEPCWHHEMLPTDEVSAQEGRGDGSTELWTLSTADPRATTESKIRGHA